MAGCSSAAARQSCALWAACLQTTREGFDQDQNCGGAPWLLNFRRLTEAPKRITSRWPPVARRPWAFRLARGTPRERPAVAGSLDTSWGNESGGTTAPRSLAGRSPDGVRRPPTEKEADRSFGSFPSAGGGPLCWLDSARQNLASIAQSLLHPSRRDFAVGR
ncbi:MAG: hypothetical protein BJ554DRAFT_4905 [Olpidium bornovanus]|uniref:Uncharacterized protein n=1 Tax=Olpidium bornovanus TaxID=278681 RepID=A0A8H8DEX2_9FUNG|nr:MAG: hypothetical protein BJ554DRAFT_4905 [Olpidium bornovanus]